MPLNRSNISTQQIPIQGLKAIGWARYSEEVGGCFIAGTRVQTDKGLVRIEEIKVGDMVLSQPEGGGEQAYKRVLNTFVYQDKTLRCIRYRIPLEDRTTSIYVTENHPFLAVEETYHWEERDEGDDERVTQRKILGWTAAGNLLAPGRMGMRHLIQLADGTLADIVQNIPVYRTDKPGCGWVRYTGEEFTEDDILVKGSIFDCVNYDIIANNAYLDQSICFSDDPYLKVPVYNIEVEDYHTYFVGKAGVWVHNQNCEKITLFQNAYNKLFGKPPPGEMPRFDTSSELTGYIEKTYGKNPKTLSGVVVIRSGKGGFKPFHHTVIKKKIAHGNF